MSCMEKRADSETCFYPTHFCLHSKFDLFTCHFHEFCYICLSLYSMFYLRFLLSLIVSSNIHEIIGLLYTNCISIK